MNKEQIAYLAGIIDADGSIGIRKDRNKYRPTVSVCNTNKNLIKWCYDVVGVGCIKTREPCKKNHSTVYDIVWIYDKALDIASLCLPYLIVKRKRAGLLLKWKGVTHRNGNYTKEKWQRKMDLINEMYRLNKVKEN